MDVRALKDSAAQFFRKGRFGRAAECYEQLCRLEPREGQHYIKLGDSHRRDGQRESAVEAYRRAVDEYVRQGVIIKAIAACKLILEIDPEHQPAQDALADLCSRRYVRGEVASPPPPPPPRAAATSNRFPEAIELEEEDPEKPSPEVLPGGDDGFAFHSSDAPSFQGNTSIAITPPPAEGTAEAEEVLVLGAESLVEIVSAGVVDADDDLEPVAESTSEQELLRRAAIAAERPPTAMATILSESLILDDEESSEDEELVVLRTGEDDEDEPLLTRAEGATKQASSDPTPPPSVDVDRLRVPLLSGLPREAFLDLLAKLHYRRYAPGEVVVQEGEVGRSLFVVATGKVKVVKGLDTDRPRDLAVLDEGAFFGEMALLDGTPRVASVVAVDECELLELTDEILRDVTSRHPAVSQALRRFYRQRLLANVLSLSPIFRSFGDDDRRRLVARFKLREVADREVIIREGQAADGLYVLMHGVALVTTRGEAGRVTPLAVLREGDVFGEMALLGRQPATATVSARRGGLVLRLPKADFDELMFTHPAVLEVVSELSDQRVRANELLLAGKAPVPPEAISIL